MKVDLEGNVRAWGTWSSAPDKDSAGWSFFGFLAPLNTVEIVCRKSEGICTETRAEIMPTRMPEVSAPYSLVLRPPTTLYIQAWTSSQVIAEWSAGFENATLRISLRDKSVELTARENSEILGEKNVKPKPPHTYVLQ